jgi:hypothetical protein
MLIKQTLAPGKPKTALTWKDAYFIAKEAFGLKTMNGWTHAFMRRETLWDQLDKDLKAEFRQSRPVIEKLVSENETPSMHRILSSPESEYVEKRGLLSLIHGKIALETYMKAYEDRGTLYVDTSRLESKNDFRGWSLSISSVCAMLLATGSDAFSSAEALALKIIGSVFAAAFPFFHYSGRKYRQTFGNLAADLETECNGFFKEVERRLEVDPACAIIQMNDEVLSSLKTVRELNGALIADTKRLLSKQITEVETSSMKIEFDSNRKIVGVKKLFYGKILDALIHWIARKVPE